MTGDCEGTLNHELLIFAASHALIVRWDNDLPVGGGLLSEPTICWTLESAYRQSRCNVGRIEPFEI